MKNPADITVLIVDDEEEIRDSLKLNLELDQFQVMAATGGNEAIQILKNNVIDFVISDVRMPNGDGISLLNYVKLHYPNIPHITLFSGQSDYSPEDVKKLGAIDLISKPLDIDALVVMIKTYCNSN